MPTVAITASFACAVQHLQAPDGRLVRVQYGRSTRDSVRFFLGTTTELHFHPDHRISREIYDDLRKFGLIEQARNPFGSPVRKVYQLSDAGKSFKLPAEKFWIADPETTE